MKPTVQYSPLTRKLFDRYLNWSFKRSFDNVFCSGLSQLEGIQTPLLFVPNHVSWWDGFFLFEIQRRARPKARLYTIALEKTCIENPILPKMGVLPLRPEDPISFRSLLTFLQQIRTEQLPEELAVGFFPQGRITPSFLPDLNFRRGIEKIISVLSPVTLVPVGIHVEP
ncbi:hypothetical protein EBT16_15220, partial [bacterium]|nr:hypothetical protein [bacterium]